MMVADRDKKQKIFAVAPGCDFPAVFVQGFSDRYGHLSPDAIARIQIFVNTSRAKRRIGELMSAGPDAMLPRIRLITDLAGDVTMAFDMPPAPSKLRRRLELGQLVRKLIIHQPDLAPLSASFDLAGSLTELLDEMHGEGVDAAALQSIDVAEHSEHWARSLKFLNILIPEFSHNPAPDTEARQRIIVERLIAHWENAPPGDPVIVAGSTGSRGATALFMAAVARQTQGAVVLPGFDFDLPNTVFDSLADPGSGGDHPQAVMSSFLKLAESAPAKVQKWANIDNPNPGRNALVSLALRPAPVTDQWLTEGPLLADVKESTRHVDVLEAPDLRSEVIAIAARLRAAVAEGQDAVLISPDRNVTRRVTAALTRWHVTPDDSAGQPLSLTPPGIFLRLTAELLGSRVTSESLLAVLKHPFTHSGADGRPQHLLWTRDLEIQLLRNRTPYPDTPALRGWAAGKGTAIEQWIDWMVDALRRAEITAPMELSEILPLHLRLANTLTNGTGGETGLLWAESAGAETQLVLSQMQEASSAGWACTFDEYRRILTSTLADAPLRESVTVSSSVAIMGTLEARVRSAPLVILGGLNEGTWPQRPSDGPWLSRSMRAQVGLLLPERKIGLSAHDFQQAIGAPQVMVTRATRDADAPTVASRWLVRLTNLLKGLGDTGIDANDAMRARGQRWLDIARDIEAPKTLAAPATRPSPCPPVAVRPSSLSVTRIKTLIRDPYSIYCEFVLRLKPLDPLLQEPDALLRGNLIHKVLEQFVSHYRGQSSADKLLEIASTLLDQKVPWHAARRIWMARLARVADGFVADEAVRHVRARPAAFEVTGSLTLSDPVFTLRGTADRIDIDAAGHYVIYDYKTGAIPTPTQLREFDMQLPLEALIARRGGFKDLTAAPVSGLTYIGLGAKAKTVDVACDPYSIDEILGDLKKLLWSYGQLSTGYTARSRMFKTTDFSAYDHLSRRGEWQDSDSPVAVIVP